MQHIKLLICYLAGQHRFIVCTCTLGAYLNKRAHIASGLHTVILDFQHPLGIDPGWCGSARVIG